MSLTPDTPPVLDQLLSDLAQEPNPRRRRQLLQARPDLWRPENVNRFYDEARARATNVQHAERIARATWQMAERLGEDACARLACALNTYYRKRKYEASPNTTNGRWRYTGAW
jgi:hypothetical protein